MSLSRLLEIVNLLLINKSLTVTYLADYFNVSTRTIYRDIDKLTLANIPIYSNQGKNGGFSLLEGYTINKQLLDKDDQVNIINALNEIPLASSKSSLNKLNALFNIEHREWIEIDFKPWYEMENTNIFQELKTLILNNISIHFEYLGSNGQTSLKHVYPYKIFFKSQGWYLVGYDIKKEDYRIYKVNRMLNIKSDEIFDYAVFRNLDVKELFLRNNLIIDYAKKKRVVLKIDKRLAFRIYDEFRNSEIQEEECHLLVSFDSLLDDWFKSYLLSFLDAVEIVEPLSLKKDMKELLTTIKNKI